MSYGPNFAGGSSSGWTSSASVGASDGAYATAAWSRVFLGGTWEVSPTPYLVAQGFGFALGAGDNVAGVTVEVTAKRTGPDGTLYAFLAVGGVQKGTAKAGTLNASGDTVFTFGGPADKWGGAPVGADINALQVVIYAEPSSAAGSGTVSVDYVKVTVEAADATPNAFNFTDVVGQEPGTLVTSDAITVAGITASAVIEVDGSASDAQWEKNNSGAWNSGPGSVVNGDTVRARASASIAGLGVRLVTVVIGGVTDVWNITTRATDTAPNAFAFADVFGATPGAAYNSNAIVPNGYTDAAPFNVTGGFASVNGGPPTLANGTLNPGDIIYVRGVAAGGVGGSQDVTLNVGGVSDTFTINNVGADTTPDPYTWTDAPAAGTGTVQTSNTVVLAGIGTAVTCNFSTNGTGSAHQYSKNGAAFAALPASVALGPGETLALRMTAPAGAGQSADITTEIGGVIDTWTVSTGDITPNAFVLNAQTGVVPGSTCTSNAPAITGINVATAVNVDNGATVSINGGAFATNGFITTGQTLAVRVRAPLQKGKNVTVNVTVGTVTQPFSVTTLAGPVDGDL